MSHPKDKSATIKATGQNVTVYKLANGNWCDAVNCKTQYKPEQLKIK